MERIHGEERQVFWPVTAEPEFPNAQRLCCAFFICPNRWKTVTTKDTKVHKGFNDPPPYVFFVSFVVNGSKLMPSPNKGHEGATKFPDL
jgi:hypothetical protein